MKNSANDKFNFILKEHNMPSFGIKLCVLAKDVPAVCNHKHQVRLFNDSRSEAIDVFMCDYVQCCSQQSSFIPVKDKDVDDFEAETPADDQPQERPQEDLPF